MSSTCRLVGWRRAAGRIGGTAIAAAVLAGGAGVTAPAFARQVPGPARGPALAVSGRDPGVVVIPVTPPTGSGPLLRPGPLTPDAPAIVVIPDPPPTGSGPLLIPRLPTPDAPATVILTGTGGGDGPGPK
jgi:hypothetical protein